MRLCVCPHLSVCLCVRAHRWWTLMTVEVGRQPLPPLLSCRPPTLYKIGCLTWRGWLLSEPHGSTSPALGPPRLGLLGFWCGFWGVAWRASCFQGTHVTEVSCQATRSPFLRTETSRLCVRSFSWHLASFSRPHKLAAAQHLLWREAGLGWSVLRKTPLPLTFEDP